MAPWLQTAIGGTSAPTSMEVIGSERLRRAQQAAVSPSKSEDAKAVKPVVDVSKYISAAQVHEARRKGHTKGVLAAKEGSPRMRSQGSFDASELLLDSRVKQQSLYQFARRDWWAGEGTSKSAWPMFNDLDIVQGLKSIADEVAKFAYGIASDGPLQGRMVGQQDATVLNHQKASLQIACCDRLRRIEVLLETLVDRMANAQHDSCREVERVVGRLPTLVDALHAEGLRTAATPSNVVMYSNYEVDPVQVRLDSNVKELYALVESVRSVLSIAPP